MAIQVVFEAVDKAALATLQKVAKGVDGVTEAEKRNKKETSGAGEVWKNLTSNLTVANLATSAIQGTLRAVSDQLKDSVAQTVKYAEVVRELGQVNGQTAEDNSRLIQVTDDYKITVQDLIATQRELNKDGTIMTTGFLADVADRYAAAATQADKNKVAQDALGKSWRSYIELLQQGKGAILEMSSAVDGSLVLTQQNIDAARQYELALDDLNDSIQGVKISIGNSLVPVLTDAINGLGVSANYTRVQTMQLKYMKDALDSGKLTIEEFTEKALSFGIAQADIEKYTRGANSALDEQKETIESINFDNMERMSFILDFQAQTDNLDKAKEEIKAKMAAIEEEIRAARAGGDTEAIPGLQEDFANLVGELQASEAAFKQWQKQAVFAMIQTKLAADGLTDEEFGQLLNIGQDMGLLDEGVVAQAQGLMDTLSGVDTGSLDKAVSDVQYLISQDGRTIKIYVEQTTSTTGGGTMPTTGAPTTATSGGDTFINYGPQYFYGTTLSGILSEWR